MDAEMIILCDGVVIPQSKKEIDGGVAIAGGHILRIGARAELSDYLGVDTEVVEYHNSTLFTFDRTNTEGDANIAVVAGNMKHHGHGDLKKTEASLPDVSRRCGNSEGIMKSINNK